MPGVFVPRVTMARDARLKASTRKAVSKKRRAWNKKSTTSSRTTALLMPPAAVPLVDAAGLSSPTTASPVDAAEQTPSTLASPVDAAGQYRSVSTSVLPQVFAVPVDAPGLSPSKMPTFEALQVASDSVSSEAAEPADLSLTSTSAFPHVASVPTDAAEPSSRAQRFDTVFFTEAECAGREKYADNIKTSFAKKSATSRKFELMNVGTASEDDDRGTEYIVHLSVLKKMFVSTSCSKCGMTTLQLAKCSEREYGLAVKLELTCSNCDFAERHFSSPRVPKKSNIAPFEVNLRAMKGIQSIGKGATALVDFCAIMNLSRRGLHHKTFRGHMDTMVKACQAVATATEAASVKVVMDMYKNFLNPPGNVDVIFDGTWKTRGHNSNIAIGCIIELYTGLVLDHVVLSRYCRGCQGAPDPNDDGYGDWAVNHKCMKNIDCNAGRMETEAAIILFNRSLEKNGLRYTTIFTDGDSRTFHALTSGGVYGYISIEKKDCLNHVHKRMGTALRNLVEKKKAQGESLGGKGNLTQDKKITNYYGYALRSHDVAGMKTAVHATLLHMTSTDEAPDHSCCPQGVDSWCAFNRALANQVEPPPHKNPLPGHVRTALEPIFARLGDEALLERCKDGMTQNAIKCLHSVIWSQSAKNTHDSLLAVERAVAEAVSRFNQGMAATSRAVAAQLGYSPGSCLIRRSLEKG
ncbi:uncharacterized protein [Dermacentor albipictus]|uniref:uncharacterized protein n=1 Tax=Dermacentor albipictus TaxID=60249 RepID=UPI0038FC8A31